MGGGGRGVKGGGALIDYRRHTAISSTSVCEYCCIHEERCRAETFTVESPKSRAAQCLAPRSTFDCFRNPWTGLCAPNSALLKPCIYLLLPLRTRNSHLAQWSKLTLNTRSTIRNRLQRCVCRTNIARTLATRGSTQTRVLRTEARSTSRGNKCTKLWDHSLFTNAQRTSCRTINSNQRAYPMGNDTPEKTRGNFFSPDQVRGHALLGLIAPPRLMVLLRGRHRRTLSMATVVTGGRAGRESQGYTGIFARNVPLQNKCGSMM